MPDNKCLHAWSRRLRIFERPWITNERRINRYLSIPLLSQFFSFFNAHLNLWRAVTVLKSEMKTSVPHKFPNFPARASRMLITMLNEQENERKAKQSQFVSATSVADLISRTIKHANHRCNLCTRKRIAITTLNRSCCECINSACITQLCPWFHVLRKQEIVKTECDPISKNLIKTRDWYFSGSNSMRWLYTWRLR